jgi:hypothetical protein
MTLAVNRTNSTSEVTPKELTERKSKMNGIFGMHFARAALGAVLASAILLPSAVSADRGLDFTSAPERPIEEYVLGEFRIEDRSVDDFLVFVDDGDMGGADAYGGMQSYGSTSQTANAGYDAADDFKAGPGCSIQCITSGVAYARGPNAKLVVKTDTLARIWIHVEGPNGYYRVENSGADEVMEFGFVFDDLQAGTTYQAWAVAKDMENYESEAHGSFTTLERNVEIFYTGADLIERAFGSDADFKEGVWINGAFDDDYTSYDLPADGYFLSLGINYIQLNDVERYLDFGIELYEAPDNCNNLTLGDNLYFGPTCGFMSFAKVLEGEDDLDARPAGADSWTEWTLHRTMERPSGLWQTYDPQLLFEVPVTLYVTYTPPF